jgi:hypothetical protein
MAKIDLITLKELTAVDGSIILTGATIKFSSEFLVKSNHILIRPKIYRSRSLFDQGYDEVVSDDILKEFTLKLPEEEFYSLTPMILYEKVMTYINTWFDDEFLKINIVA